MGSKMTSKCLSRKLSRRLTNCLSACPPLDRGQFYTQERIIFLQNCRMCHRNLIVNRQYCWCATQWNAVSSLLLKETIDVHLVCHSVRQFLWHPTKVMHRFIIPDTQVTDQVLVSGDFVNIWQSHDRFALFWIYLTALEHYSTFLPFNIQTNR